MIRNQVQETVQSSGFAGAGAFRIKSSEKAFKILSSNIYSNKIQAIIRELSTNAVDAHILAGTQTVPFEITLPDRFTNMFSIRDYGTGLSYDEVMNLYVTYFDSTKETSNDFAGTLGLGSKSPFSYINSFNVTSFYEGQKYVYTAYVSEAGMPEILFAGQTDTTEPNGIMVSFPTKKEDTEEFRQAAKRILAWFDAPFTIVGEPELVKHYEKSLEVKQRGSNWLVYSPTGGYVSSWNRSRGQTGNSYSGAYVKQGPILYPINQLDYFDDLERAVLNKNIILFAEMGQIDFEPGRENISYDKFTIGNIKQLVKTARAEMETILAKEVSGMGTKWEKTVFYYEKMQNHSCFLESMGKSLLTANDILDLSTEVSIPKEVEIYAFETGLKASNTKYEADSKFKPTFNRLFGSSKYNMQLGEKVKFFTYTNGGPYITRFIETFCDTHKYTRRIVIAGPQERVDKLLEQFGNPPVTDLNDQLKKVTRTVSKVKEYIFYNAFIHGKGSYSNSHCYRADVDLEKAEGYYIVVKNFSDLASVSVENKLFTANMNKYQNIYNSMFGDGKASDLPRKVYVIREADAKKIKNNKKLKSFDDAILQQMTKHKDAFYWMNLDRNQLDNIAIIESHAFKTLLSNKKLFRSEETKRLISDLSDWYQKIYSTSSTRNLINAFLRFLKTCAVKEETKKMIDREFLNNKPQEAEKRFEQIKRLSRYPLLLDLTYSYNHDRLIDYINSMDELYELRDKRN